MKLSLVVPCFNEEDSVYAFYNAVQTVFSEMPYDYEIVFVNDGSKDNTLAKLTELFEQTKGKSHIQVIGFSRNFGKEAAIYAGLQHAQGDYVSVIDADLQQRPEVVAGMVDILEKNKDIDCVAAYQADRKESKVLTFFKNSFYKIINSISDTEFVSGASDFRTMRRKMTDAVLEMSEYHRFSKGIFSWVGFNTMYIPYEVQERAAGESKWSFKKLFRYALDGILGYTTSPLRLASYTGILSCVISLIYLLVILIGKWVSHIPLAGYKTCIFLILLIGGIQLIAIGIIGEYLAKTYMQVKKRPVYIQKEYLSYKD